MADVLATMERVRPLMERVRVRRPKQPLAELSTDRPASRSTAAPIPQPSAAVVRYTQYLPSYPTKDCPHPAGHGQFKLRSTQELKKKKE